MSNSLDIKTIRGRIDRVDAALLKLINKRVKYAQEIKKAKGKSPLYRPERESVILRNIKNDNSNKLPDDAVVAIFTEILSICRNLQQTLSISYLGPEGTYSHEAAIKMFGKTSDFQPQLTLSEVIKIAENNTTDIAFLPIENSSEGAVIETHRILLTTDLYITGEYTLPIKHCLLTHAKKLPAIKAVHAHPQALGQCREWLQLNLPKAKLVTEASNGQAWRNVKNKPYAAAIASNQAANLAGLPVLIAGINDFAGNKTRFIALSRFGADETGYDKTSLICSTHDKVGALNQLLTILTKHQVNLLRLESQPHADHDYVFYIDFEGHQDNPNIAKALSELKSTAKTYKVLGSYPRES